MNLTAFIWWMVLIGLTIFLFVCLHQEAENMGGIYFTSGRWWQIILGYIWAIIQAALPVILLIVWIKVKSLFLA